MLCRNKRQSIFFFTISFIFIKKTGVTCVTPEGLL